MRTGEEVYNALLECMGDQWWREWGQLRVSERRGFERFAQDLMHDRFMAWTDGYDTGKEVERLAG